MSTWAYHKLYFLISICSGTIPDGAAATYNGAAATYIGAAATYSGAATTYSGAAATYMMDQMKLMLTQPSFTGTGAELGRKKVDLFTKVRYLPTNSAQVSLQNAASEKLKIINYPLPIH